MDYHSIFFHFDFYFKSFAIITDDEWDSIKNEYIDNLKNGVKYEILEEPKVILEESKNNDSKDSKGCAKKCCSCIG